MKVKFTRYAVAAAMVLALAGCGEPDINSYAGKKPAITVRNFYGVPIEGYGFFQGRSGQIEGRYYATLVPVWNGNECTIDEHQWSDKGELYLHQTWKIHASDNGHDFTAAATKIVGNAMGETQGYAMHMTYAMLVPTEKGDEIKLDAQDWTYLQPDGSGINKVALSKYGFHVGDVTYVLHPVPRGEKLHEGYEPE